MGLLLSLAAACRVRIMEARADPATMTTGRRFSSVAAARATDRSVRDAGVRLAHCVASLPASTPLFENGSFLEVPAVTI